MGRIPQHPQIEKHCSQPPEWRMNPVSGDWVIVAPERAARPILSEAPLMRRPSLEPCPFCTGHEWRTPGELASIRTPESAPNAPGWRVRAVPNAFAAVKSMPVIDPHGDGFYYRSNAAGRHELIIECPQHETSLAQLPVEQLQAVVQLWRERMLDASHDQVLRYAQLFKNHGPESGASVEHAHSQLIATPEVPVTIRKELTFAAAFFQEKEECVYCELLHREQVDGMRAVSESRGFRAFAAYAARQPFETWIVPRLHHSRFESISAAEADELGTMLWTILRKMETALEAPPYNLVFHTAPFHAEPLASYHWHVEILPRLSQLAGFEWGTGSHVTPILPEDAALVLRETVI